MSNAPEIKVGQTWEHCAPHLAGLTLRVRYVGAEIMEGELFAPGTPCLPKTRMVLNLHDFRQCIGTTTGYRLVEEETP